MVSKELSSNALGLLCDMGDITALISDPSDINHFLKQTVNLVARHFRADVCSVYLYEEVSNDLVLKATKGLNTAAVNRIRLKPGEGLVGHAFQKTTVICDGDVKENPRFKYFEEADEDDYNSLLAMPIQRGVEKIGVLVVQKRETGCFHYFDQQAIQAVAAQLAGALENIRLLMQLRQSSDPGSTAAEQVTFLKGTPASEGIAYGPASVIRRQRSLLTRTQRAREKVFAVTDLEKAVERTARQLRSLQSGFEERLPESASLIFTAHFMMLKDQSFTGEMITRSKNGEHPADAVEAVAGQYMDIFAGSSHAYMREKALDVEDLALRIIDNLSAEGEDIFFRKRIIVAADLFPSDILKLASGDAMGFVLVGGGVASHVAILSRSLRIPLVFTDEQTLMNIEEGTPLLIDADLGNIYIAPDEATVTLFATQRETRKSVSAKADWMSETTATRDEERITLLANVNLLSEVPLAVQLKAEGIGLYRTEFPFLIRATFPSEEEQYVIYRNLFESMADKIVTIRTLDAGGDKALAYSDSPPEENPELGLRSIRFSLQHRDVFESQLRAVLRAAVDAPSARIMFPLISSLDELKEAKSVVTSCMEGLDREGIAFNREVKVGMMIELPSVLGTIEAFAAEADFFSIGTNDFVQYMLAADRTNKMVAGY